ncbi:hypothetical protein GCM10022288_26510 [Gryllotalpicola kribbensis]|uniref:Uncharacterized protein n=1 Tax=Gryllotalpicola kribbensis TaxID=993084 RepID=A0ABP8AXS7_9MICO
MPTYLQENPCSECGGPIYISAPQNRRQTCGPACARERNRRRNREARRRERGTVAPRVDVPTELTPLDRLTAALGAEGVAALRERLRAEAAEASRIPRYPVVDGHVFRALPADVFRAANGRNVADDDDSGTARNKFGAVAVTVDSFMSMPTTAALDETRTGAWALRPDTLAYLSMLLDVETVEAALDRRTPVSLDADTTADTTPVETDESVLQGATEAARERHRGMSEREWARMLAPRSCPMSPVVRRRNADRYALVV